MTATPTIAIMTGGDGVVAPAVMTISRRLADVGYRVEIWGHCHPEWRRRFAQSGFRCRELDGLWSPATALSVLSARRGQLRVRRALGRRLELDLYRCELCLDRLVAYVDPAFAILDSALFAYYPLLWARRTAVAALSARPVSPPSADACQVADGTAPRRPLSLPRGLARVIRGATRGMARATAWRVARAAGLYTHERLVNECVRRAASGADRRVLRQSHPALRCAMPCEWHLQADDDTAGPIAIQLAALRPTHAVPASTRDRPFRRDQLVAALDRIAGEGCSRSPRPPSGQRGADVR